MGDRRHVLGDGRPFVESIGECVGGGSNECHAAFPGLSIGIFPNACAEKRVVDGDASISEFLNKGWRENPVAACEDKEIGLLESRSIDDRGFLATPGLIGVGGHANW